MRNVADLHGQRFYEHLDETLDAITEVEKDEEQLPLGNDAEQRERLEELSRRCRRGPYAHFLKGLFGFVDGHPQSPRLALRAKGLLGPERPGHLR